MQSKELFDLIKAKGLVKSREEFSSKWLNKAKNHYTVIESQAKAKNKDVTLSKDALHRIFLQLVKAKEYELAGSVYRIIIEGETKCPIEN